MGISDAVLEALRTRVRTGFFNRETLLVAALENSGDALGLPPDVRHPNQLSADQATMLRDAIERIFLDFESESRTFPPTTDCERLQRAFETLESQGIVTAENNGADFPDGMGRITELAVVRDEAGTRRHDGFCFFHEQDVLDALNGEGLLLSFGSFRFSANAKGSDGSKPHAVLVGESVCAAMREEGLSPDWSGAADERILLENFSWQRRSTFVTDADLETFWAGWALELRLGTVAPTNAAIVLGSRALEFFAGFTGYGPAILRTLLERTQQLLASERAEELTWSAATDCDRLQSAFAELRTHGVFAADRLGLTIQDGWAYAGAESSPQQQGVVFCHDEDLIDAAAKNELHLAFGAVQLPPERDEAETKNLGALIGSVLTRHGLDVEWNGDVRQRIRVAPFRWQKRRWTAAPEHSFRTRDEQDAWLSKLASASRPAAVETAPGAGGALVVRAKADEAGIDARRSARVRALAGNSSVPVQAGHVGHPHIFLRGGEHTTLAPIPQRLNLREEKDALFERGVRGR